MPWLSWTEAGHRFAWHMKLRDKVGQLEFYVTDPQTKQTWLVVLSEELTARQLAKLSTRPDMILQYAHYLRDKWHLTLAPLNFLTGIFLLVKIIVVP